MLVSVVLEPVALCVLIFGGKKNSLSVVVLLPAAVVAYLNKSNSSNVEFYHSGVFSFFVVIFYCLILNVNSHSTTTHNISLPFAF